MSTNRHPDRRGRLGFTIVELLVVISIIGLLIAILLPAVAKARDNALVNLSRSNLRNLGVANAAYWGDFNDRQPTFTQDDWGSLPAPGSTAPVYGRAPAAACANAQQYSCQSQMVAGFDNNGGFWGFWVADSPYCTFGCGGCTCANYACFYAPLCFPGDGAAAGFGAFRLPTIRTFTTYLNGRWYDPINFAGKDRLALDVAEKYYGEPGEFNTDGGDFTYSSYCWSPAAMWNFEVLGGADAPPCRPFRSPAGTASAPNANAYKSPTSSQAKFASLKVLMHEHNWLQNPPPQLANPAFTGGRTQWFFNQGYNSNPVCLFFDLSISLKGVWQAMQSDSRARTIWQAQSGSGCSAATGGLWVRNTPFGANGYFGAQAYDNQVLSSFSILTRNGIAGRDFLSEAGAN